MCVCVCFHQRRCYTFWLHSRSIFFFSTFLSLCLSLSIIRVYCLSWMFYRMMLKFWYSFRCVQCTHTETDRQTERESESEWMKENIWDWNSNEIGRMKDHQNFVVHCEIINKVQFKWNGVSVLLKGAGNFNCNCNCDGDENGKYEPRHCVFNPLLLVIIVPTIQQQQQKWLWQMNTKANEHETKKCIQHIQKFWMFRVQCASPCCFQFYHMNYSFNSNSIVFGD